MTEIGRLDRKEFVVTITWVVDAGILLAEGTEEALERLRAMGSADIMNLELRDIKK